MSPESKKSSIPVILLKLFIGTISAIAFLCAVLILINLVVRKWPVDVNNLHIAWLLDGHHYFVPADIQTDAANIVMRTNQELSSLDNDTVSFTKKKKKGSFRIFCIGGSTTSGWPFHHVLSYPKLLSLYLESVLPTRSVEVINSGLLGSDSFSDISLVEELLTYQPDLIILYEGRNEGWNFPLHTPFNSCLLGAYVHLARYSRLFQIIGAPHHINEFDHNKRVREFAQNFCVYNRRAMRKALMRNLARITTMVRKNNCSIIILTQVTHSSERNPNILITKINEWVKEFARNNNVPVVDIDRFFCESKVPEEELVIPINVHPNFKGYALMARVMCRELFTMNIIAPKREWQWKNLRNDSFYFQRSGLTRAFLENTYKRYGIREQQ